MDPEKLPEAIILIVAIGMTADLAIRRERSLLSALARTLRWGYLR
jgi:hypothetical protein